MIPKKKEAQMPPCRQCGSAKKVQKVGVDYGRTIFQCSACGLIFKLELGQKEVSR